MKVYVKIFDKESNDYYGTFILYRNEHGLKWLLDFWGDVNESECLNIHLKKDKSDGHKFFGSDCLYLSFKFEGGDLENIGEY